MPDDITLWHHQQIWEMKRRERFEEFRYMMRFKLYSWFCFVVENWTCKSWSAFMLQSSHFRVSFVFFHFIISTKFFIVFHKQQVSQFFILCCWGELCGRSKFQRRSQAFRIQKNSLGATFCSGTLFFPEGNLLLLPSYIFFLFVPTRNFLSSPVNWQFRIFLNHSGSVTLGSVMYIRVEGTAKADPLDIELKHACGTCQHRHSWIC